MRSHLRRRAATVCVLASCLVASRTAAPALAATPTPLPPGPVIEPFDVFAVMLSDRPAIAIHADRTACDRWLSGPGTPTPRVHALHAPACLAIRVAHRVRCLEPGSSALNRRGPPGTHD
jgi:hypothetical protein